MITSSVASRTSQIDNLKRLTLITDEDIFAVEIQMDNILLMDFPQDTGQIDSYF